MAEDTNCQEILDGSTCKQSLQVGCRDAAIKLMIDLLEEKGYLVIPDSAFPAVGIDSEYVTEVAMLMAQLGIAKDDIAEHLQAVARFRNLVLNLDINDAQWEAMIRWFREFMRTFGGFDNGTEG